MAASNASTLYVLRGAIRGPRPERLEEQARFALAGRGDHRARDLLIASHIPGVVHIAKAFRGRGVPFDDLIAEGCVGLLKAIRRYDPDNGTRFMTYASFWVRKEILAALASQPNAIHVPQYARRQGFQARRVFHLDVKESSDAAFSLVDQIRHPDPLPAETVIERERSAQVQCELQRLQPRDRAVLVSHYGLDGEPPKTLNEISRSLGLSRERVRQIEMSALGKLRHAMTRRSRHALPGSSTPVLPGPMVGRTTRVVKEER